MSFKGNKDSMFLHTSYTIHFSLITLPLDPLFRLEPVIIELERQRAPVVVIAHQVSLSYFHILLNILHGLVMWMPEENSLYRPF
jgi:hypothetical protein